ncbi:MAG: sigma-70 family RNA polymerase sigma factor [Bacteroidota bacterium]
MLTFAHFTTRAYPTLHRRAERLLQRETVARCAADDLLHDAYLRLAPTAPNLNDDDHGYRLYALTLRRLLADKARQAQSVRHGGQWRRVPLTAASQVMRSEAPLAHSLVTEALAALGQVHAGQAQVLRLCQLEGYTQVEAAEALAVSVRTVKRWTQAGHATCAAYLRAEQLA